LGQQDNTNHGISRRAETGLEAVRALFDRVSVALFDFDGVIADTEVHQLQAYRQVLTELGVAFGLRDFEPYMGRSEAEIYALLQQELGLEIDAALVSARRLSLFLDNLRSANVQPFPVIAQLLHELHDRGIPAHILSSNVVATIEQLLDVWGLRALLGDIYAARGPLVTMPKLDVLARLPEVLGVPTGDVLLFEDSARVLAFARSHGMRTVGIRHSLNAGTPLNAHAELSPFG
jgi:beta-phosphoglucomutase-like phosphatase (HAD superfamily)